MPFTLAHPAAVLPLRGFRYLRTAPLIIGAMIPDSPYYVPGNLARYAVGTHSFIGSFTSDLALGYAALAGVFLLRRPLTALLSARARGLCLAALAPFSRPLEWALALLSILLGVWTHLLWDSFTHTDGWTVHRITALSAPVTFGPYTGTVCHVLQYLSSVFGLTVMGLWYARLPAPPAAPAGGQPAHSPAGPVLLLAACAAILIGSVQATEYFTHAYSVYRALAILLTRSIAWFAALYLLGGIIDTLQHAHERA
jgi:hypothetical protein